MFDASPDLFCPEHAEREPCFECTEAAGQVKSDVARPYFTGAKPTWQAIEIWGWIAECPPVSFGVADKKEPRVVGNVGPFVKIEGDRVGALDAIQQWFQAGRE